MKNWKIPAQQDASGFAYSKRADILERPALLPQKHAEERLQSAGRMCEGEAEQGKNPRAGSAEIRDPARGFILFPVMGADFSVLKTYDFTI